MSVISGTIRGCTLVSDTFSGKGNRQVWLLTADFAAYGTSDSAALAGVGAAISAKARDSRSRTLRWAAPAFAGIDASGTAVYACGTTGGTQMAMEVSTDALAGTLCDSAGTEIATAGVTQGVGLLVGVDAA